jgi:hypothetical protein
VRVVKVLSVGLVRGAVDKVPYKRKVKGTDNRQEHRDRTKRETQHTHLKTGVHLEEVKLLPRVDQELHRACQREGEIRETGKHDEWKETGIMNREKQQKQREKTRATDLLIHTARRV